MQTQTAIAEKADLRSASPTAPPFERVWPLAFFALAVGLTVVWTGLLGYALVFLVKRTI
jgi:hypothetical protein